MREETSIERAIAAAFRPRRRLSRRAFLRQSGKGVVVAGSALTLPSILAACGIGPAGSGSAGTASTAPLPSAPAGVLDFANWPAYIDIDEETGDYPTLARFEQESGIDVTYTEAINDNEEFLGTIQPDLAAGNPPAYDLIVMTDWMIEKMIRLGYLAPLDHARLPNFEANALDLYRDPWYDPGNAHSIAFQSGITGIGYNPELTGREITTFDDLLDPAFSGRVGMFSEMRDTMSLTLLSLGITPEDASVDQATQARDKLLEAAERGQFRNFYGNEYYDELANGNLALTIAWSGDVSQMKLYDNDAVEFVIPDTGGMLWVDNMAVPTNVRHPLDAHMMMDFWYDIESAVPLTEYVGYFSPVSGVTERVLEDADAAEAEGDTEWAEALRVISATANPTDDMLANVHNYKRLTEEEEAEWNDLFNGVIAG
jgi:spermidine/putrescine transport system substrate-binding protein